MDHLRHCALILLFIIILLINNNNKARLQVFHTVLRTQIIPPCFAFLSFSSLSFLFFLIFKNIILFICFILNGLMFRLTQCHTDKNQKVHYCTEIWTRRLSFKRYMCCSLRSWLPAPWPFMLSSLNRAANMHLSHKAVSRCRNEKQMKMSLQISVKQMHHFSTIQITEITPLCGCK